MTTVTVLSSPERRRRWSTAEKRRIVAESDSGGLSVAELARRHDEEESVLRPSVRVPRQARGSDQGSVVGLACACMPSAWSAGASSGH
jgi:transposase